MFLVSNRLIITVVSDRVCCPSNVFSNNGCWPYRLLLTQTKPCCVQSFSELGAHEVIDYEVEGGVGRAEQADERPQERVQPVVPPGVAQVGHEERGCLKGQGGSETDDEENGSSDQHPGNCHLFTDEVSLPLAAVVVADS